MKGADLQRVRIPPGKGSLQPEAIGAAEEVTNLPEPLMEKGRRSDSASMWAVTRVNVEQASKSLMREPTRPDIGEGCHLWGNERQVTQGSRRGIGEGTHVQGDQCNTGNPSGGGV